MDASVMEEFSKLPGSGRACTMLLQGGGNQQTTGVNNVVYQGRGPFLCEGDSPPSIERQDGISVESLSLDIKTLTDLTKPLHTFEPQCPYL